MLHPRLPRSRTVPSPHGFEKNVSGQFAAIRGTLQQGTAPGLGTVPLGRFPLMLWLSRVEVMRLTYLGSIHRRRRPAEYPASHSGPFFFYSESRV
jgi:hypothetical protein